jgi:hypothetical protein
LGREIGYDLMLDERDKAMLVVDEAVQEISE